MIKVGLLVLGRKRPGFDPDWGATIRQRVIEQMRHGNFELTIPPTQIGDDASLRTALAECDHAGVEVYVLVQPTMSDANLGVTVAQHAAGRPIILWATPERQEGENVSACSLVGVHTFGSTLRLMNKPFEVVYGMPGDDDTVRQLDIAVRLCHAADCVLGAKVALIGYHAPGFIDMHSNSWQTMDQLGVQLRHISLHDFIDSAHRFDDQAVEDDLNELLEMNLPQRNVDDDDLRAASRLHLAMKQYISEESLDALAIRCWSELPGVYGQWPYLGMFRLAERGFPAAPEGDIDGAMSLWIGSLLGFAKAGYLSDWLEHDDQSVTLWHTGNAPTAMLDAIGSDTGPVITRHFNNNKPAVVDGTLKTDMPVTVFRLWSCDNQYFLAALEGQTIKPRRHLTGNNGLARINGGNLKERFDDLLHEGLPHHVAVFPGCHTRTLERFARLMGIHYVD